MRRGAYFWVIGLLAVAGCVYASLHGSLGGDIAAGDYGSPPCNGCDAAGPPIEALVHGHVAAFFAVQPFQGSVSLLLRAPFVGLVTWLGGGFVPQYRVGTLVCLLTAALLLLPAVHLMLQRGQRPLVVLAIVAAIVVGPIAFKAIVWGHPEEFVGGAIAVAAVLAAGVRRPVLAAVLLGLAIATKQWGVFAAIPVFMLVPGRRRLVAAVTAAVIGVTVLPMFIGDPARFMAQNFNTAVAQLGVTPTNIWFPFHHFGYDPTAHQSEFLLSDSLRSISHPLAVLVVLALSVGYWVRGARDPFDAVGLLALLFLVRCLLDPLTISYHHAPFLIAVGVFEGLRRRGLPVLTLTTTAAILLLARYIGPLGRPSVMNAAYLAWALPTAGYLGYLCFRPIRQLAESPSVLEGAALARPALAR